MSAKLKLAKSGPITERRYPWPRGVNPDVPPASWPFAETRKQPGDLVISAIARIDTRSAKTPKSGLVRRMRAGLSSILQGPSRGK